MKSDALPPLAKRIPEQPCVVKRFPGSDGPGRPGGQLNMLASNAHDTSLKTVYSYMRLIIYDDQFKLHPDIRWLMAVRASWVAGESQPLVIHGMHRTFDPPTLLARWPDDDRRSRLVFITRDLDRATVAASWAEMT